jgi:glycosylphosphatidylinositol transamidase (GPIT) subunit GPI8
VSIFVLFPYSKKKFNQSLLLSHTNPASSSPLSLKFNLNKTGKLSLPSANAVRRKAETSKQAYHAPQKTTTTTTTTTRNHHMYESRNNTKTDRRYFGKPHPPCQKNARMHATLVIDVKFGYKKGGIEETRVVECVCIYVFLARNNASVENTEIP